MKNPAYATALRPSHMKLGNHFAKNVINLNNKEPRMDRNEIYKYLKKEKWKGYRPDGDPKWQKTAGEQWEIIDEFYTYCVPDIWLPIRKFKPIPGMNVLVSRKGCGWNIIAYYNQGSKKFVAENIGSSSLELITLTGITHWRPLPSPPKL